MTKQHVSRSCENLQCVHLLINLDRAIHLAFNCFLLAAILCAGVTSYKALKETEARPGDFVTIIGAAGGLGHLAIQYGNAMGLRVIAVDVGADKLKYCEGLGAEYCIDASSPEAVAMVSHSAAQLYRSITAACMM